MRVDAELDATGLFCPEPVMLLHNAIRDLGEGAVLKVQATDASTQRDIPKFCLFLGHELIKSTAEDGNYCFWIRKRVEPSSS